MDNPDIPCHGKFYLRRHFKRVKGKPYTHIITVPVARQLGCNFKQPESKFSTGLSKHMYNLLRHQLDYDRYMDVKCEGSTTGNFKSRYVDCTCGTLCEVTIPLILCDVMLCRISECHGTVRGNCNLQDQVACAADALNPGNDNDMIRFLLNLYAIIKAGSGTKGLRVQHVRVVDGS